MWADQLLGAERAHLLRIVAWGAVSVLVGTAVVALALSRLGRPRLLTQFGVQTIAWGIVELAIALWGWSRLHERDLQGAARLLNVLWFRTGLEVGCVAIGATLALAAWRLSRSQGAVGAGVAIVVQGMALAVLDLRLIGIVAAPMG
jgi:hypothetical protein